MSSFRTRKSQSNNNILKVFKPNHSVSFFSFSKMSSLLDRFHIFIRKLCSLNFILFLNKMQDWKDINECTFALHSFFNDADTDYVLYSQQKASCYIQSKTPCTIFNWHQGRRKAKIFWSELIFNKKCLPKPVSSWAGYLGKLWNAYKLWLGLMMGNVKAIIMNWHLFKKLFASESFLQVLI